MDILSGWIVQIQLCTTPVPLEKESNSCESAVNTFIFFVKSIFNSVSYLQQISTT